MVRSSRKFDSNNTQEAHGIMCAYASIKMQMTHDLILQAETAG